MIFIKVNDIRAKLYKYINFFFLRQTKIIQKYTMSKFKMKSPISNSIGKSNDKKTAIIYRTTNDTNKKKKKESHI